MSLVDYSSSDDDRERTIENAASPTSPTLPKRKREQHDASARRVKPKLLPALPSNFHTLYSTDVRTSTSDDPTLHGGRQRQVPHAVGNWPSFVYLEWLPSEQDLIILERVVREVEGQLHEATATTVDKPQLHSLIRSNLGVRLPLHVSLSSPLTLTTDNKDIFEKTFTKALRDTRISAFQVLPFGLCWVSNFDQSRYFLILVLSQPQNGELNTLLKTCNEVCRSFGLPELYGKGRSVGVSTGSPLDNASTTPLNQNNTTHGKFHVSIAWTLSRPDHACEELVQNVQGGDISIPFNNIHIKIGNAVSVVPFEAANDYP